MICETCGAKDAMHVRVKYDEKTKKNYEMCDKCSGIKVEALPDVFFDRPYFDENLADDKNRKGTYIESKRHKAKVLRELGLRESGDRINPMLGKKMPYISDPIKRQKFMKDNFE